MDKNRKTSHILNIFQYDEVTGAVTLPSTLTIAAPSGSDNSTKVITSAWARTYVTGLNYLTAGSTTTSDIGEGTNLYFTTTRVNDAFDTRLALKTTSDLTEGTNLYYTTSRFDTRFGTKSTTDLSEGTNLYYTQARFNTAFGGKSTTDLTEGTNLYYTAARFNTAFSGKSTTDLSEGTNLYYTDGRVGTYLTNNSYATQSYVGTQIANLVSTAPATLDTLAELATALGSDPNFATTVTTSIGTKVPQTRTITINGTSYDLTANRTWTIPSSIATATDSAVSGPTSGQLLRYNGTAWANWTPNYLTSFTESDPIYTASSWYTTTNNATNWNTAYSNRITSLTTTGSSGAATLSANTLNIPTYTLAGLGGQPALSGTGFVKISGTTISYDNSTYLTGITSSQVTTALGFTPYNSTNPSGYISSYTETDTLSSVTGRGATTSSALSLNGKVTFSSAVVSRPQMPGGILGLDTGDGNFDIWGISRDYYPSHATAANAWGLRWNGDNNDFEFVGGGTSRVILDMDGGNITATGTLSASGYNKTNWDTAYGWGNHASAGYQAASTAITTSNIGSQSVSYATSAGNANTLDSLDSSDFMRNYGMLNNTDVYVNFRVMRNNNSSSLNDGMYIGYGNSNSGITRIFGGGATSGGINVTGSGVNDVSIAGSTVWNAGNLTNLNQLTNGPGYITSSGSISGNAATATNSTQWNTQIYYNGGLSSMTYIMAYDGTNARFAQASAPQVQSFLGLGSMAYASTGSYVPYSNLADSFGLNDNKLYLRTKGDNNHFLWNADDDWEELRYYTGTGFRVQGSTGSVSAYFTNAGIYAAAFRGKDNVAGTGEAVYAPAGLYSTGNNWLYGTMYQNGNVIRDNGGIVQNNIVGYPNAQWGATGATGPVIISFPGNTNNYGMVHAVIDIYEYSGNNVCTIIVGGHNWGGSQWYNYGAQVIGYTDKPVRVGIKDGRYCIIIGNGSSSWSYGQVVLRKIQNGAYYSGIMDVGAGYTVAVGSDSYTWASGDLRDFRTSTGASINGNLSVASSLYTSGIGNFGADSGSDQGIAIKFGNDTSGYGRIRFYQSGTNFATIHTFSSSWQSGSLSGSSTGAINIDGGTGATFGAWNNVDAYITKGGSAWFRYDVTAYSDARVKTNVQVIDKALDKIHAIKGVTFTRTDQGSSTKRHAGVIAQDVLNVLPEVVSQDTEGMYSVAYGNMAALFIEAIKEQQLQIEDLKKQINYLVENK